jgi:hypothetical protein
VQSALDKLKSGDASGITDTNSLISSVEDSSSKGGAPITENEDADLTSTPT